jgi:hypothetical protein
MPTPITALETIEDFLAQKRIAMIGVSRNPKDFSAALFQEFRRCGYDMVPVNPKVPEVMGQPCYARVQDIQPPVDGALLMTKPEITDEVVTDCAAAGIRRVWMYRAGGKGAVSLKAVAFCQEHGIQVIPGQCPFSSRLSGCAQVPWIFPKDYRPLSQAPARRLIFTGKILLGAPLLPDFGRSGIFEQRSCRDAGFDFLAR